MGLWWLMMIALSVSPIPQPSQNPDVKEEPGNAIQMDDEFEYRLLDYGIGKVQLREKGSAGQRYSDEVFWVEFSITNRSEHLIRTPRYFSNVLNPINVEDNWGNHYNGRGFQFTEVGGNFHGVTLPAPHGASSSYKPGEASKAFRIVPLKDFVQDVSELRIYVTKNVGSAPKYQPESHYFRVQNPFQRRRDFLYSQADQTTISGVSTVGEFSRSNGPQKKQ